MANSICFESFQRFRHQDQDRKGHVEESLILQVGFHILHHLVWTSRNIRRLRRPIRRLPWMLTHK